MAETPGRAPHRGRRPAARALALTAALGAVFVGGMGLLHTPYGRPLLRHLGVGCPAMAVSPAAAEATRQEGLAHLRTGTPAPARPALGLALDVSRRTDVAAWARGHGLTCAERQRPSHTLTCADIAGAPAPATSAPPNDEIIFAFAPDGRLVGAEHLRRALTAEQASTAFLRASRQLGAALGDKGEMVGDAAPAYLAGGTMHTARLQYRYADYLATITAINVGGRIVVREQYASARG